MLRVLQSWYERYFSEEEALVLFLVLALLLVGVLVFGNILGPVLVAVVIAFLMQGLVNYLVRFKVPHVLAVFLVSTLLVGFLMACIFLLLPLMWNQLSNLFNEMPRLLSLGQELVAGLPEKYPEFVTEDQLKQWVNTAGTELAQFGQWALSYSLSSIPNVVVLIVYLILVPILVFFFLKDREEMMGWLVGMLPKKRGLMQRIWLEMDDQIANYVRGKVIEIFLVGGVSYIAFQLLGLNYAALVALLVGLSVIIPYIGAAVVTLPVALVGILQWGWGSEFFYLMLAYGIIQTIDGNVLVPFLFSEVVDLHPVAIIIAVLFFGGIWGFWGVFFAIPLATLIKAVLNAWPRGEPPSARPAAADGPSDGAAE